MKDHQCGTHCDSPGLTTDEPFLTEVNNAHGQHYWKAVAQIGTIFGSEVEGEISAMGSTREQALERLVEERRKFYESLWF